MSTENNVMQNERKSKLPFIIGGVVALGGLAVLLWFLLFNNHPAVQTAQALNNFNNEVSHRLEHTPLSALGVLGDMLTEGGTINVSFEYEDNFPGWEESTRGDITLAMDVNNSRAALAGELYIEGLLIDFQIAMSQDYIAFQTDLLNGNFYGITFETFRQDFTDFGNLLGLAPRDIRDIADMIEEIHASLTAEPAQGPDVDFEEFFVPYRQLFRDMIFRNQITVNDVELHGQTMQRVEYTVSEQEMVQFLLDVLLTFEDQMVSMIRGLDNPDLFGLDHMLIYELTLLRDEIHADNWEGIATLVFYMDNNTRLSRLDVEFEATIDGDHGILGFELDLGANVYDTWVLTGYFAEEDMPREEFTVSWEFSQQDHGYAVNLITIASDDMWEPVLLMSQWNQETGRTVLSYQDQWDGGQLIFTFFKTDNSFTIRLDEALDELLGHDEYESIYVEITVTAGNANIPQTNFINMSDWGFDFLFDLLEAAFNLGLEDMLDF